MSSLFSFLKAAFLFVICMSVLSNMAALDPSCALKKLTNNIKQSELTLKQASTSSSDSEEAPLQDSPNLSNSSEEEVHACADGCLLEHAPIAHFSVLSDHISIVDEAESQKVLFLIHRPPSVYFFS